MAHQERVNIAVFIDFDNIEIGVKTTLGEHFDIGIILEALKERGEVVTKIAYADWTRAGEYSRALTQHAIRLVQRNLTPGGDKNGADINLALDALEMAFTHSAHQRLRHRRRRQRLPVAGREAEAVRQEGVRRRRPRVHEHHPAAQLPRVHRLREPAGCASRRQQRPADAGRRGERRRSRRRFRSCAARSRFSPTAKSRRRPACSRARCCSSTRPSPSATTAPRRSSTSPRSWPQAGLVQLKHSGRSVMVELNRASSTTATPRDGDDAAVSRDGGAGAGEPASRSGTRVSRAAVAGYAARPAAAASARRGGTAAGTGRPAARRQRRRRAGRRRSMLGAATGARWPMYLRNVKQILRGRGRLRRAALRLRRADGSAEGLPARRARPGRARSPRRPARVPGPGAAGRRAVGAASAGRTCRSPTSKTYENQPIETPQPEPIESAAATDVDRDDDQRADRGRHDRGAARPRQAAQAARARSRVRAPARRRRKPPRGNRPPGSRRAARSRRVARRRRRQPLTAIERTAEHAEHAEKTTISAISAVSAVSSGLLL